MKKENRKIIVTAGCFLVAFALWTLLISLVDVRPIGPQKSFVGLAGLNSLFHRFTGAHMLLYTVTDWLSLIPLTVAAGFGLLGLAQWIHRKSLLKVDRSILVLGGFYLLTGGLFLFFEYFIINYRPVLIDGILEASYPSSTTLLTMCVMPTAMLQLRSRIHSPRLRKSVTFLIGGFTVFMVIGRLISGVHWLTDIIGGVLLSSGLVLGYHALAD